MVIVSNLITPPVVLLMMMMKMIKRWLEPELEPEPDGGDTRPVIMERGSKWYICMVYCIREFRQQQSKRKTD